MKILDIRGREILDSRGNPTVEVDVVLEGGARGRAAVPSGASTGEREALELRDGDAKRYLGKGVGRAVAHINEEIRGALQGRELLAARARHRDDQARWDGDQEPPWRQRAARRLDGGAEGRRRSHRPAALRAHRAPLGDHSGYLLPVPMMNIINGGAHADSNVDFQEFMVMPLGFTTFSDALRAGVEIFHALRGLLKKRGLSTGVGDEGGFAPNLKSNREALDVILEAVSKAGYSAGKDVYLALDVASSEFSAGRRPLRIQEVGRTESRLRRHGRAVCRMVPRNTRSSRSRTVVPKAIGAGGRC